MGVKKSDLAALRGGMSSAISGVKQIQKKAADKKKQSQPSADQSAATSVGQNKAAQSAVQQNYPGWAPDGGGVAGLDD